MQLWKVTMTPEDSLKQSPFWGDFSVEVHTYPSTSKTRMAFLTSFARITLLKNIYIYNFIHMCEKEAIISRGDQDRGRYNRGIGGREGKEKMMYSKKEREKILCPIFHDSFEMLNLLSVCVIL